MDGTWSSLSAGGALAVVGAVVGASSGAAGARALRSIRAPAPVPVYWCAGLVGLLWTIAALRASAGALSGWWLAVSWATGLLTVLAVGADLAHRRLPDLLTLRAPPVLLSLIVLAAWAAGDGAVVGRALLGGLVLTACYAFVHLLSPQAMGAGDVKLAMTVGMVSAAVSWPGWLLTVILAPLITGVAGLVIAFRRGGTAPVPHGPGMVIPVWLLVTFRP
ncbi:leader peptidase (prepilin peptidase)/N-methyltransferase [Actinoalloteichus hoggarensis]|nr:A24 family peptidase [Actinoalloteichus hoggarensis]MBB5919364.1 leader peptidase (prepilin peptidase)/N-methyltransferase [Actinoalloteichus hoggarensis]